jgi:hypothetical protein
MAAFSASRAYFSNFPHWFRPEKSNALASKFSHYHLHKKSNKSNAIKFAGGIGGSIFDPLGIYDIKFIT